MTDAAISAPAPSASELSENIGDVLASIRRMIAQDGPTAAEAPPRPEVLRLGTVASPAGNSSLRWTGAAVPAQRDELLARAQSWTRRAPPGPGTLRLERSEIVPAATPGQQIPSASTSAIPAEAAPVDAASAICAADFNLPAAVADRPASEVTAQSRGLSGDDPNGDYAPATDGPAPDTAVVDMPLAAPAGESAVRLEVVPQAASVAPLATAPLRGAAAMAGPDLIPAKMVDGSAATAAIIQPDIGRTATAIAATDPAAIDPAIIDPTGLADWAEPAPSLTETILLETAMNAYAPTHAAADAVPEDEATDSIFSNMIRDVIRQELGDPSGRMSRDLRAMILREVARAITSDPAKRA